MDAGDGTSPLGRGFWHMEGSVRIEVSGTGVRGIEGRRCEFFHSCDAQKNLENSAVLFCTARQVPYIAL